MLRLTMVLGGLIWVVMAIAPKLENPVFTEVAGIKEPVLVSAPEVSRSATNRIATASPSPQPEAVIEVATEMPPPATLTEQKRIVWYITGTRVNVREGPSTSYAVLDKVAYGEAFEVVSDPNADWIKIRIEGDGVEGYIVKRFTTEKDPFR